MIAFLGTGLLGANFVRALRRRGTEVNVWNRTFEKARVLEEDGAKAFREPVDAVRGAERVHLTVSDGAAVDDVLERAKAGLAPGVIVVDHSTVAPEGVAERAKKWGARGVRFLQAPVFMGPKQALEGGGVMLASGPKAVFEAVEAALGDMTGKIVYLGEQTERAAGLKLIGNLFIFSATAGLMDALNLAKAVNLSASDVAGLLEHFNPGAGVPQRLNRIVEKDYVTAAWTLEMARKDARLMLDAVPDGGNSLPMVKAIAAEMDKRLGEGHGQKDWMVIAKDALP